MVCSPGFQRFGEVPEAAVAADVGNRLAVDDQRRTGFGLAENFHYAAVQLRSADFQHHLLSAALRDDGEFESFADFAGLLVGVRGDNVPEIISGIESADIG